VLESLLRIKNFCWSGAACHAAIQPEAIRAGGAAPFHGRFACASQAADGSVSLVRDPLGLNKLFIAIHDSGRVVAANYLADLVGRGVPFEAVYSVPAGHVVRVAPAEQLVEMSRYADADDPPSDAPADVDAIARDIRGELEGWLSLLAEQFGDRSVAICLSGGLDSGLIAALARKYFPRLTGYTYSFSGPGVPHSEDAIYAERLASVLGIPFRLVPATADDLAEAVEPALRYGQDWRDFNVHCAIVNDILARAIRSDADHSGEPMPLVLTGDLANEFLADYEPVPYGGKDYYQLPRMEPFELRRVLVRGLDSGDREVGVFNHHGLDVVQPYGLVAEQYHRLPRTFIGGKASKQVLVRKIAGDLLPAFVYDRPKVRAQVGDATANTGILPLLIQRGQGAEWMRRAFCRLFNIDGVAFLDRFIRGGRYRTVPPFRKPRLVTNGYVTG
jgi:asparagine synthetase B (glutamine-hydrolysing)